jgi:octaprenyl-diphosphate synthase
MSYSRRSAVTSAPTLALLQALVKDDITRVDQVILSHIDSSVPLIPKLARYIIAAGGKRLRPALTLLCARLCGYSGLRHVQLAASVEFIHTATLLHDDVVDESAMRRGNATANDVWGNKASVLVGDFLLSRAFQLMVADGSLKVLTILSNASAVIAQGEVLQLTTANNPAISEEQYLEVVTAKTATLFSAACELGAVVTDRPELEDVLRNMGLNLGIAFQIVDDALDYSAEQETLGKTVGDDFREGKITLPVIFAYTRGTEQERAFWERTLEEQAMQEGDLQQAIKLIYKYQGIEDSIARAEAYCVEARKLLATFPPSVEKEALFETIDFCTQRAY